MGQLGTKTIDKLEKYATYHFNPVSMGFSAEMQVRIMIAEQMFQAYESKRIPLTRLPRKVVGTVAETVYRRILTLAQTDQHMAELAAAVGIREDASGKLVPRPYTQLTNDIEAYDVFRRMWGMGTTVNHAKAIYEEGAMELIDMGTRNSNGRDLKAGLDALKELHNNFQESADDHSQTASTERDFISDVTLIRPDAENVSPEDIEAFKKKYGAYVEGNIEDLIQQEDGTYAADPGEADPHDDEDFFERVERQQRDNS